MNYSESALQKVREDRLLIDEVDGWLYEEIQPHLGRRVLEIGCGLGNFARRLIDRELYIGTEISEASLEHVRDCFRAHPNVQTYVADATSVEFRAFGRFEFDTVFSLNVFEHIEDHMAALRNVRAILVPGGVFVLVVPAHDWLYGDIDTAIGHYRRYNKKLMPALMSEAGMTCVSMKYINMLGALGWLVNSRILKKETPPAGQLRLLNKITPVVKRIERLVPTPFGVSILTVARAPHRALR